MDHPARAHLGECSPCFGAFTIYQLRCKAIKERKRSWLVAGIAGLVLVLVTIAFVDRLIKAGSDEQQIEVLRHHINNLAALPDGTPLRNSLPIFSLLLVPGLPRGGTGANTQRLLIAGRPSLALLMLRLSQDNYPHYDVEVENTRGEELTRIEGLSSQQLLGKDRILLVTMRSELLPEDTYVVRVLGVVNGQRNAMVASYTFVVLNQN